MMLMPIALTVIMICFNGSLIEARTAIVPAKDGFWYKLQQQARDDPMCNKMRLCSSLYVQANGSVWWDAESIKTPNDMLDTEFLASNCHCDNQCIEYGDCCYDAYHLWARNSSRMAKHEQYRCLTFSNAIKKDEDKNAIYVIGKCPSDSHDIHLENTCSGAGEDDPADIYVDIPVRSLNTNITYANIYCATCHNDAHNLQDWNITVRCSADINRYNLSRDQIITPANYQQGKRQWSYTVFGIIIVCQADIVELDNMLTYAKETNSRRCIPVQSDCASDWDDPVDQINCRSYSSYIAGSSSGRVNEILYRNEICARCNHAAHTSCPKGSAFIRPRLRIHRPPPLSIIFDFRFSGSRRASGRQKACKVGQIWDHFQERCQQILCGSLYHYSNGSCILLSGNSTASHSDNHWQAKLNSSCPRIVLPNSSYIVLSNMSLFLNETNSLLAPSQYESFNATFIQICANHFDYYFRYSSRFQSLLSQICLSLSVASLIVHIGLHAIVAQLRNHPSRNLLCLSISLLCAQLLFLTILQQTSWKVCALLGVLTHWFFLASFFWMNVMSFDIWRTFCTINQGNRSRTMFLCYSAYAWGCPTILTLVGWILDMNGIDSYGPQYGQKLCWISNKRGLAVFFVMPVAILLSANVFLFSSTVMSILKQKKETHYLRSRDPKRSHNNIRFVLYIKLALIMGLGWIFGFVAALTGRPVLWYPFTVFNGLQGAFIFMAFDCKRKTYELLYQTLTGKPHPSSSSSRKSLTLTNSSNRPITMTSSTFSDERSSSVRLEFGDSKKKRMSSFSDK